MFLVAVIGWIITAVVGLKEGNIDLIFYLKIVLVIAAISAGSWGLSALAAISYGRQRRWSHKSQQAPARNLASPQASRPWGSKQGSAPGRVIRFTRRLGDWAKTQLHRGQLPIAWLLLIGLGGGAIAGALAFKLLPNFELRSSTIPTVSAHANFRLCGSSLKQNCVIDGDTIRYGGEKIRLVGFDTPEIFSPKCASELELGQRAKHRLLELMNAGPFEVSATTGPDRDVYGRKLRIITRDGRSVGDTLIAEGMARRWDGARRSWCG